MTDDWCQIYKQKKEGWLDDEKEDAEEKQYVEGSAHIYRVHGQGLLKFEMFIKLNMHVCLHAKEISWLKVRINMCSEFDIPQKSVLP